MTLQQQSPFLVCVPIRHNKTLPGLAVREVEALLDQLGGPNGPLIKEALDGSGIVHFMSLSVVWDEQSIDPPMLVADISADGAVKAVIAALVVYAGIPLLPVFQAAAGVGSLRELQKLFERCWVKPVGAALPILPHRATGLPFQGTPGLTVKRVKADETIALNARAAVVRPAPRGLMGALDALDAARAATSVVTKEEPFNYSDATPSLAKAGGFVQAWAIFGLVLIDWSFLFIFLFSFLFLNTHDLRSLAKGSFQPDLRKTATFLGMAGGVALIFHLVLQSSRGSFSKLFRRSPTLPAIGLVVIFGVVVAIFKLTPQNSHHWFGSAWVAASGFQGESPLIVWMAFVLSLLAGVVFVAIVVGILAGLLHAAEQRDRPCDADPDPELLAELLSRETRAPHKQNHMIAISTISPGLFRRYVSLPAALYAAILPVRAGLFRLGFLARIGTIHCLQWTRIPGTSKLVFTAIYDGSWQSYLEDAITLLPTGATAIWSNAVGFPKTRWLFLDGAKDGDRFKRWVRRQMIPTRFWYSAYPHLTTTDIRLNAAVRQGLEAAAMTPSQAEAWLKLFGSAPRSLDEIETNEIQGVALSGYRRLLEGALLGVSFPKNEATCREWLADVGSRVHFGDDRPRGSAMAVALSHRGLRRLGLDATHPLAARFSPAFAMGMASEARAGLLGDVEGNAPEYWKWGGPENPVDAVLLVYALDKPTLGTLLDVETKSCVSAGMATSCKVVLRQWPAHPDPDTGHKALIKEPFGFVDGISQPAIRGLLSSRGASKADLLRPGEFILGYRDGRKKFPPTPQVLATADPETRLADLPPNFPPSPVEAPVRDLGRNGSYLVIRQLEQDVVCFNSFLQTAADQVGEDPEWVAAKMMGRWRDGAPLVLHPHAPPDQRYNPFKKDETFTFGRDDPQGVACPMGAHIRRANPRDQFDANSKSQISITDRHRIIRRGRSYVAGEDSEADAKGLLFMCLNADIERQFEFLQQTWIGSTSFGPLRDEADPITTPNRTGGVFTIPMLGAPKQLTDLPSFVKMIGGGYFFLPGRRTLDFLSSPARPETEVSSCEHGSPDPAGRERQRA